MNTLDTHGVWFWSKLQNLLLLPRVSPPVSVRRNAALMWVVHQSDDCGRTRPARRDRHGRDPFVTRSESEAAFVNGETFTVLEKNTNPKFRLYWCQHETDELFHFRGLQKAEPTGLFSIQINNS